VLITANDSPDHQPGREITQDTKNALVQRLMFIDVTRAAPATSKFLPLMQPERWAEDIIPKHVMWFGAPIGRSVILAAATTRLAQRCHLEQEQR